MSDRHEPPPPPPPPSAGAVGLWSRAEEWVYALNERDHWVFRLYDRFNELWAAMVFRGVRRRAAAVGGLIRCGDGLVVRMRMLQVGDAEAFTRLLSELSAHRYLPPHPIDEESAVRVLQRRSYVPFGYFVGERMVGYHLFRLFFPRRAVMGLWIAADYHDLGIAKEGVRLTVPFTRAERLPEYITVPIDNPASLRVAQTSGWELLRTNRRFHVLLRR